jgi:hypothetical protein
MSVRFLPGQPSALLPAAVGPLAASAVMHCSNDGHDSSCERHDAMHDRQLGYLAFTPWRWIVDNLVERDKSQPEGHKQERQQDAFEPLRPKPPFRAGGYSSSSRHEAVVGAGRPT